MGVKPGDTVAVNQVLVEIETAKSLVELPSPFAGTVAALLVDEGETVDVGTPIIPVDSAGGSIELQAPGDADTTGEVGRTTTTAESARAATRLPRRPRSGAGRRGLRAVLVGYGSKGGHATSRRRRPRPVRRRCSRRIGRRAAGGRVQARDAPARLGARRIRQPGHREAADPQAREGSRCRPHPGARHRLAGEVTRDDVIRQASQASVFRNIETPEWGDEREERIPVKGVRKAIATAMVSSAFTAPHVSVFVDVDATRTMEFVKRLKASPDFAGVRVSPLLIMAKAMIWAVRRNPTVNSSWTDKEIIVHHYVNLGIAAATPRGLIVPNVKDAQELSLLELAQALEQLTLTARDGKTQPAEMPGGTITITNIGSSAWTPAPRSSTPARSASSPSARSSRSRGSSTARCGRVRHDGGRQLRPPRGRRRRREPLHRRRRGVIEEPALLLD